MRVQTIYLRALLVMALSFGFGRIACAQATNIADAPMAITNQAKSNVMFVIDTSGGMDVEVLIPSFNSMYYETNITGTNPLNNLNGFFYMQVVPRTNPGSFYLGFNNNPDANAWKARFYGYNPAYYNPNLNYKPWTGVDNTGTAFANASPTAAFLDPYTRTGAVNLTTTQTIPNVVTYLSNTQPVTRQRTTFR